MFLECKHLKKKIKINIFNAFNMSSQIDFHLLRNIFIKIYYTIYIIQYQYQIKIQFNAKSQVYHIVF